jgi:hypothetical protein
MTNEDGQNHYKALHCLYSMYQYCDWHCFMA